MSDVVRAPAGLRAAGRRLWESVTSRFDLEQHELQLLTETVRTVDLLTDLEAAVRRDGPLVNSPQGLRAHPAAVEARQQRMTLARLVAALRLPDDGDSAGQRRGAPRAPYSLRPGPRAVS